MINPQINIIGSDEVGTGSYFGGITTSAVWVRNQEDLDFLTSLGVADSKTLNDKKILTIAPLIKERIPHTITELYPNQYNLQNKAGANANVLKAKTHNEGIKRLIDSNHITNATIIIDQFVSKENYRKYIKDFGDDLKTIVLDSHTIFMTKAESQYVAVATASILAREAFLKQIDTLSNIAGIQLKQGASITVKNQIMELLIENVNLSNLGKLHFSTTEAVKKHMRENISKF